MSLDDSYDAKAKAFLAKPGEGYEVTPTTTMCTFGHKPYMKVVYGDRVVCYACACCGTAVPRSYASAT